MNRAILRSFGWILVALISVSVGAAAQTTEAGVNDRLRGKSQFLKGLWAEDKLKFDSDGNPLGTYKQGPFTLASFNMDKAKLKGDKLLLEGERTGLTFNENGEIQKIKLHRNIRIEIDGHGNSDFTKALNTIFAESLADLTPSLPGYWQMYARKHFVLVETTSEAKPAGKDSLSKNPEKSQNDVTHVGNTVKAPRVLQMVYPEFTVEARREKYSGNVQVYLWVGEDGAPSHLRIVRPAGLGLDEQALAAVQKYRFAPATRNGVPVKVDLYIDVNFQIF